MLTIHNLDFSQTSNESQGSRLSTTVEDEITSVVSNKLTELGKPSFHEIVTLILIVIGICLCCSKSPGVFGWSSLFKPGEPQ